MVVPTSQEQLFGSQVERARRAAGISQDLLGQKIHLARSKVSEICNGRYLPSKETLTLLVRVLAMDAEQTLMLWQDARAARAARLYEEQRARNAPAAASWDRFPGLPPEIVELLRAQERAAEDMPYRLPGAKRPSLSTVYVRQDLGQPVDDSPTEARAAEDELIRQLAASKDPSERRRIVSPEHLARRIAAPSRAARPPVRTVRTALDGDAHLLIIGGPGQGKSTLTLRLAADIAQVWLTAQGTGDMPLEEPVIPLRIPARLLAAHLDMTLPAALASSIAVEFGGLLKTNVPQHVLAGPVNGCRWLLLIDAIDEIAEPDQRDRLLDVLSRWAADEADGSYRLVVTSRPLHGTGLAPLHRAGMARYELQPFDTDALHRFAEHWFTADDAPEGDLLARRFLTQIRQAHLDELVRVPLLATIAAIISEQHRDRPLPDNRYDLYETYLDHLARHSAPKGPLDDVLRDSHASLLEHLAVTRLTNSGSLAQAARTWLAQSLRSSRVPTGVRADPTTYLTTRGPMIVRRDDIEFLHHSFVDHLAATARARELPVPFDPEHPVWQGALHAARVKLASADMDADATEEEAVLLHYGHLHPDQSDEMIRWLHDNTASFQRVAARLLAQHAPASAASIGAFLDTVRAWARTSGTAGLGILQQACKATHHPPLAAWLHGLMREADCTWAARIEAATVLCTLFDADHRADALNLLHTALNDLTLDVFERVAAAQGLADLDAAQRAAAADGLRLLLADPDPDFIARSTVAITLAELGADAHADAVASLQSILDDPTTPLSGLSYAAGALVEIDPGTDAAAILRAVVHRTSRGDYERRTAALALARLGPLYVDEAVGLITEIITDHTLSAYIRSSAAATLAEVGPDHVPVAADYLLGMLTAPNATNSFIPALVSDLTALGPMFREKAAEHLRIVLVDPTASASERCRAADALSGLGVEFHAEVVDVYRQLWSDVLADEDNRCQALENLAELGPGYRDEAVALLCGTAADPTAEAECRVEAAKVLIELDPGLHVTAARTLQFVMTDESLDYEPRLEAAISLASLGNGFHREIAAVLHSLLHEVTSDLPEVPNVFRVAQLGSGFGDQAIAALRNLVNNPRCDPYVRVFAAQQLLTLDPASRRDIADVLEAILDSDLQRRNSLVQAARVLATLGTDGQQRVAASVRARLRRADTDIELRQTLVHQLSTLSDDYQAEAVTVLHAILADPAADYDQRVSATRMLAAFGIEPTDQIAARFRALLNDKHTDSYVWASMGAFFATMGPDHRDEVVSAIRAKLSDPTRGGDDRRAAATALGQLGREFHDEVAEELRLLTCDRDQPADTRMQAAQELVELLRSPQPEAVTCLLEILADPCVSVEDRCEAAEKLAELDRRHWPHVIRWLRNLLTVPHAKHDDVLAATASLRQLHAITEREKRLAVIAVVNDPTAPPSARRSAIRMMNVDRYPGKARTALRALLWERTALVGERIPQTWELVGVAVPLMNDVEAALREAMTGAEFETWDRLDTLRTMGRLGTAHRQDAATELQAMSSGEESSPSTSAAALDILADFGGRFLHQAWEIADRILIDERRPARLRLAAARVGLRGRQPRSTAIEYLRQTMREDPRPTLRADAASALVDLGPAWRGEAIDELRRLVHASNANPYIRWKAADDLARWSPPDRAVATGVIDELTRNPTTAPALRWQAAKALARHGATHRLAAVGHLRTLIHGPVLPASARLRAAAALVELDPRHIRTAAQVLRDIANAVAHRPADRRHAWVALAGLGSGFVDDACAGLREVAHDESAGPTVQWRAAEAMARLHRGTTDEAALIIREIVRSTTAPAHVRWRAARILARLSPTCRDEALDHLASLTSTQWSGSVRLPQWHREG